MGISQEELKRDYVICLDRSGSMDEAAGNKPISRWKYAQEAVLAIARKCAEMDPDGIDVYTFNKSFQHFANTTPDKVAQIFKEVSPQGGTDFVPVLTEAFNVHFKGTKPTTILVVTDGAPSDGAPAEEAVAKLIVATANRLTEDAQLAVQFIQIGNDPTASAFLKRLDDDLEKRGAKFDIVDAKTADDLENMSITDVLLAAVND